MIGSAVTVEKTVVKRTISDEVDAYMSTVAGVAIESVRAGPSVSPTSVAGCSSDRLTFTSSKIGFPMMNQATIADDSVIVGHVQSSPRHSRWCEIDLEPGMVVTYGSKAEHTAFNAPGLAFTFVWVARDQFLERARELGIAIEIPADGEFHALPPSGSTDLTRQVFPAVAAVIEDGDCPSAALADEVLRAAIHGLTDSDRPRRIGQKRRIDSRNLVRLCVDYAESIRRIPSISELCLVAHVSERRLRKAFVDEFDQPPSHFFRAWALTAAHRRLSASEPGSDNVTRVASDLGFSHLGRFAGQYRAMYGETPSSTLHEEKSAP